MGASIITITRATDPDRMLGLFYGIITVPQAIFGFILPVYVIPAWGSAGCFITLALLAGLACLFAPLLESKGRDEVHTTPAAKAIWSKAIIIACTAIVAQNAATGAIWSYLDRVAAIRGFNAATIGTSFGVSLLMQIVGGFAVAILAWRLPYLSVLMFGLLAQVVLVLVLGTTGFPLVFIAAAAAFGLLWIALLPFYLKIVIELDPSREVALLLFAIGIMGFSLGPFTASFFVDDASVDGAVIISIIFFLLSSAGYMIAERLHRRSTAA